MTNSPYIIRNYQPADFKSFVQFSIDAVKLEPDIRYTSSPLIAERLSRPNYSPEQDLFIVEAAGNIAGYMDITIELTIGRVILDCWIHPLHRRKGLATKLLGYAENRAKELGARIAHVNVMEDNIVAQIVLSRHGFQYIRRFLELNLDLTQAKWHDTNQTVLQHRCLQPGEEDKLTQIQNRSFADTWGYNPNTVEDVTYRTSLSSFSPEDVIFTCDGDNVLGYCWTGVIDKGAATAKRKGRIFMIGVDPSYRGREIGKMTLIAGLAHLKSKGLRFAELTVDSENKVACSLYRAVGFTVRARSLWYQLTL